jgi:hypothetical protein
LWGGVLPILAVCAIPVAPVVSAGIAVLYVVKVGRIALRHRSEVRRPVRYAIFMLIGNLAEFVGIVRSLTTVPR